MFWAARKERVRADLDVPFASPVHASSYSCMERDTAVHVCTSDGSEWIVYVEDPPRTTIGIEQNARIVPAAVEPTHTGHARHGHAHGGSTVCDINGAGKLLETSITRLYPGTAASPVWDKTKSPSISHPSSTCGVHTVVRSSHGHLYVISPMPKACLHDLFVLARQNPPEITVELDRQHRFMIFQMLSALHQVESFLPLCRLTPHHFVVDGAILQLAPLASVPRHMFPYAKTSMTQRWCAGEISNLDYLLAINAAAGRSMASNTAHAIVPWVTDFTSSTGRVRDLGQSKFRLTKGDAQMDQMFEQTGYHVPENLSDLSVAIYLARVLPRAALQRIVRSNFEPKEYPSSIARMFAWSPDECIPEFYLDDSVLTSIHDDMDSLQLPPWCSTPATFIAFHRQVLESDAVSTSLHLWIDLNFGVGLCGPKAIQLKNVTHRGFRQLFHHPHPIKRTFSSPLSTTHPIAPVVKFDEEYFSEDEPAVVDKAVPLKPIKRRPPPYVQDTAKMFGMRYAFVLEPCYGVDDDVRFSLGCIIAEMYLGKPLFSPTSIAEYTALAHKCGANMSVRKTLPALTSLSPVIRRLVVSLLHPNPSQRSSIDDLLQGQIAVDPTSSVRIAYNPVALFPPYFRVVYGYLCSVTPDNWIDRTQQLVDVHFPRDAFALIATTVHNYLDRASPVDVFDALVRLIPPFFHLLDTDTLHAFVSGHVTSLYEMADDDALQLCLLAPAGLFGVLWDRLGATFLLKHILPILMGWLRQGSPVVKLSIGFALLQLASVDMMGPSIGAHDLLPPLLALAGKSKIKFSTLAAPLPIHGVGRALVLLCSELHPSVVQTTVLPTMCTLMEPILVVADQQPPSTMVRLSTTNASTHRAKTVEKYQVYMLCKTIRQLLSFLSPYLAMLSTPPLLHFLTLPTRGDAVVLSSLVHTILRLAQTVGTDITKQSLCPPLHSFLVRFPHAQFAPYMHQLQRLVGFEHLDSCLGLPTSLATASPVKFAIVDVGCPPTTDLPPSMAHLATTLWQEVSPRRKLKKPSHPAWTAAKLSWPVHTLHVVHDFQLHETRVRALAVLDHGRWLLSSSSDGVVRLRRTSDLQLTWQLRFKWPVHTLLAYAGHQCILCDAQSVYLYDVVTQACTWQWKKPGVPLLAVHVLSEMVAVATAADTVALVKPCPRTKAIVEWKLEGCLTTLRSLFGFLAVGTATGHFSLVDADTGVLHTHVKAHNGPVVTIHEINASMFLTIGGDKLAILWRWPSLHPALHITNMPEAIEAAQVQCIVRREDDSVWLVVGHGTKVAIACVSPLPPKPAPKIQLAWLDVKTRHPIQAIAVLDHLLAVGTYDGKLHLCA
ncbi:Aste57867_20444 [Aphanomyces stellatus]|uniref:Aste57867_20444 protein n=1 Tax=Aphanomyces stellatus TaxID=120398 RepID=A0A485LJQ9_9STRA|nr:hypothetical protein As57867_020378 [Aphanomyces stellatus]VFT97130.1 Aste57867_20444 [Aphanomyces stellatus]